MGVGIPVQIGQSRAGVALIDLVLIEPILSETLDLLEWSRLCDHLSTFAATKIGAIACRQLSPWMPRHATERALDLTEEALQLDRTQAGGVSLQGIYDLVPLWERAERGGVLQGEELNLIAITLSTARRVRRIIDEGEGLPVLKDLIDTIRTYPELEQEIRRCLDDQGTVRETASEKLQSLRKSSRDQRSQIQDKLQRLISQHNSALQESVITQRENRFVLPVKATHKDQIRGIVHDSSASGATLYVEPFNTVDLNNTLRQIYRQIQVEEERILRQLSEQVGAVASDLEHLQEVMVELDLILARARYSLWLEGNRPQFRSAGLSMRQVRHPLLLWQNRHEQQQQVIPIDFKLDPQIRAVLITGPNTGGKTVALKTLGLMVMMAKAGIFLPARDPVELPWFESVYADIGDEQSLQQSLSTFSGHIRRIGRILDTLDPDPDRIQPALVLLDEVGAGTDPNEGATLASALLQHLAHRTLLTMASTHYGELKSLKYQYPEFENASVEFDEITLSPTYRLLWGIPGRSNALTIAERLQLPHRILERARSLLQGEDRQVDVVIEGLERQRSDLEARSQQVEKLHRELETLQQEMQQRSQRLKAREEELDRKRTEVVDQAIRSARGEVAGVIRRLQKGEQTPQAAQKATAELDQLEKRYSPKPEPVETEFYPEVGDRVRLKGLDQKGEIISISGDEFVLRSGILKFTATLDQLAPLDEIQEKKRQRPKAKPIPPPEPTTVPIAMRTRQNTFDLRGKTVAEAEEVIEGAIAEIGSGPIWLIHGHGTGRLRSGVHQYLKSHPRVASFTAAEANEGGSGATVAQIQ